MRRGCVVAILLLSAACAGRQLHVPSGGSAESSLDQCLKLSERKKYEHAIECLEVFKSRYRGTQLGQEAELHIGDNFFRNKEFLLAAESYEAFIRNHPLHARVDYALYRLGLSYLQEAPKAIDRDQEYLDDALKAFESQLRLYPQSTYRADTEEQYKVVMTRLGRRHFYIGNFYYRTGEYRAAIPRLYTVVALYGVIPETEEAFYKLVRAYGELQDLERARRVHSELQQAHPASRWTKRSERYLLSRVKQLGTAPAADAGVAPSTS